MVTLIFLRGLCILSSQVVLSSQSVMEVANFCAAMDTLIDQDAVCVGMYGLIHFSAPKGLSTKENLFCILNFVSKTNH